MKRNRKANRVINEIIESLSYIQDFVVQSDKEISIRDLNELKRMRKIICELNYLEDT